jgi:hypothetical protein
MSIKCAHFEEMFRVAQNKQFGKSSEVCPDQSDFFNEAEHVLDEELNGDTEQEEPEATSPKRKSLRAVNCQWIRFAKTLLTLSATMKNSVVTVATSCIRWVKIKVKNLSSFLLK